MLAALISLAPNSATRLGLSPRHHRCSPCSCLRARSWAGLDSQDRWTQPISPPRCRIQAPQQLLPPYSCYCRWRKGAWGSGQASGRAWRAGLQQPQGPLTSCWICASWAATTSLLCRSLSSEACRVASRSFTWKQSIPSVQDAEHGIHGFKMQANSDNDTAAPQKKSKEKNLTHNPVI